MKKIVSFSLVLAVLLSAFALSVVTTASAETAKEFVIDGNLDVWYLNSEEGPTEDLNYYHYTSLDAYNKDPENGHGVYFFDGAETAAEVYMAYDDNYVYVYVKCWDDDIARHEEDVNDVSEKSDSIEVWFDPDPNSQTTNPDGTEQEKINGEFPSFPDCTADPEQGDVRFRMRASDLFVGDMHNVIKPPYGGISYHLYFREPENLRGFYFENEPREVANGDVVSSGYGLEARLPRYDVTGGNAFRVNVACNNRCEDVSEWYALAMGASWWLDYSTANQVVYPETNPFFAQDITGKSMYYTENEYNAAGMAVKEAINQLPETITVLEKAQVQGIVDQYNALNDIQKGYVHARNYDVLKAAADKLGLELDGPAVDPNPPVDPDPPTPPTPTVKMGDLNDDGKVDAKDALNVLKISVNKLTPTDDQKVAADVNEDDAINAKDALEILKKSVGKPSALDKFDA